MFLRSSIVAITCRPCIYIQCRHFGLTPIQYLKQKYRKEKKLPLAPNSSGVLTDSPDYSFLDGRIAPIGQGQKKRMLKNHEAKMQIIALSKEIDFAIERYNSLQREESNRKKEILDAKLKPKGQALLNSK